MRLVAGRRPVANGSLHYRRGESGYLRAHRITDKHNPGVDPHPAIAALERDRNVFEVDGVPIWQIQQWLNKEIVRLKEDDDNS